MENASLAYLDNPNNQFYAKVAQIVGEYHLETGQQRKTDKTNKYQVYRYKVRIFSIHDDTVPDQSLPWAYPTIQTSGLGAESSGAPIYAPNSYVLVKENEDESGSYTILHPLANSVGFLTTFQSYGSAVSGFLPGSQKVLIPQTHFLNGKLVDGSELFKTTRPSDFNEKQNTQNETVELGNGCKKVNTEAINKEIAKLIKDVQKLKSDLTGKDSFLQTSQNFINDVQSAVNSASSNIANWTAIAVQEIRKYINRKVNAAIRDLTGNVPLSQRYLINEVTKETLSTISCLFVKLLQNLENIIRQILNAIIDKVVNTAQCVLENLLGNLIGQILSQLTTAINGILGPISSLIGSVISFTNEILNFVVSILDFLECKVENVCPTPTEWNFLEGAPSPAGTIDFNKVFQAAQGVVDSVVGAINIPQNLNNFVFSVDANAAFLGAAGCLGFGPQACGAPNVVFWGGSGSGATGNAVLNAFGDIIGVDIIAPGNYSSEPVLTFEDNCGNGVGAYGIPILGDVEVPVIDTTTPTETTAVTPTGTTDETGTTTAGTATTTVTGVTGVVMIKTGYGYLPAPDGSKGGMGRVWADRCQTIVRRANGDWDPPYSSEQPIKLFFGDMIQLPGKGEVHIDCDFTAAKLPGCDVVGTLTCLKSMIGFDDGRGTSFGTPTIRSMVGFDDIRGSSRENTPPISPIHATEIEKLVAATGANWAIETEIPRIKLGELTVNTYQSGLPVETIITFEDSQGRDEFDYVNDYPYAKELGFSDQDIRFYLEGYYTNVLGKKIGPLMQLKLDDPNFGPLPKYLTNNNTVGVFDYENDYPYAVSLGFTDQDIRYYLEKSYTGKIAEDMQRKLNDSNWGRIPEFYVTITAPPCPDQNPPAGNNYDVITSVGDVYIEDGGFGFVPGDTATLLDCAGNPDAATKIELDIDQNGSIVKARVVESGTNFTCIPEIKLNTQTGYNARLKPVLRFTRAQEIDVPAGTTPLKVIDCVGKV